MGWWGTCYQLGSMMAKAFAAFMVGWLSVEWSFFGASIVLFAIWIAFYFLHRDKPEDLGLEAIVYEVETTEEPTAEENSGGWPTSVIRTLVIMGMAYFSFKFLRYGIDSWSSMVIEEEFNVTTEIAGYISTSFDWVGFGGVIFAGWVTAVSYTHLTLPTKA